ncbi:DUF1707 SHOCT-like domain-containing protein [Rhodococcus artemisiae]|uniref:DUF1707 SHOCT-like domain-containing protein n=1 Tax=Rhodococcus artemisiae TaxID=714159 RepID=UPI002E7C0581|nr:DUF1707 domain-containing protein [Rhodococcus artemisiae]
MATENPYIPDSDRISDSERERFVDELAQHVGSGRLTIDEFDTRASAVYASTTVAEARAQFTDLPRSTPPAPTTARARRRLPVHQRIEWTAWLGVSAINVLVWALVSLGTASMVYPWPLWVIGPWGLVLLGRTVLGIEGGGCSSRAHDARREAARAAMLARREAMRAHSIAHREAMRAHSIAHRGQLRCAPLPRARPLAPLAPLASTSHRRW